MKLRTKLILAFLLLSVLPLSVIVLYSYMSSIETLRLAALGEVASLTDEIAARIESIREDAGRGVQRLGTGRFSSSPISTEEVADGDEFLAEVSLALGRAAPFVDALEFVPAAPDPPRPPDVGEVTDEVSVPDPGAPSRPMIDSLVIHLGRTPAELEAPLEEPRIRLEGEPGEEIRTDIELRSEIRGQELAATLRELNLERLVEEARELAEQAQRVANAEAADIDAEAQRRVVLVEPVDQHGSGWTWSPEFMEERQLEELEASELEEKQLLGREFDWPIEQRGEPIGRLKARVSAKRVLQNVLSQTRRDEGEIPFAVDAEGQVHVAREEDREELAGLPLSLDEAAATASGRRDLEDWVIVRLEDPESELVYGIARPIGQSLAELRRTAVRNLGYGLGLVGLALIGVVPLSRRISRDVNALSEGAVQLAAGNLEARVPVRSRDEVGNLARTFNQMAGQLREHQDRLLQQERLRKEHEIQRRLLEAENARKSEELEAARLFQLSLLPRELPDHPELDLAVFMKTATEVGGDYYDFILGRDGALTVAVGDATGHGARAGTMVTVIKSLFTSAAADSELAGFLVHASRAIKSMDLGRMAMALTLVRYANRDLRVAAAGMPPLLIHRSGSGEIEEVGVQGLPLGAMSDYRYRERRVGLHRGDTVLLMSDGFPELANESGEPLGYGTVRTIFRDAAAGPPGELIAELARAAESWGGTAPSDDITFVALRVKV